jgi:hypothetical protein
MELLTELGLDTGYASGKVGNGEWNVQHSDAVLEGQPYILKSPAFGTNKRILDLRERWGWNVEHVYILLRDFDDVANNRWKRWRQKKGLPSIEDQEYKRKDWRWRSYKKKAARCVGSLMLQLVSENIPYTFLMFPQIITDPEYLYNNCVLLQEVSYETFKASFDKIADTNKVHWGLKNE